MKSTLLWGAAALLATSSAAWAETPPAPPPSNAGSVYVRCDGAPANRTAADALARSLLIIATMGLSGPGEMPDVSKRLEGAPGVAACDAAIAGESDELRRVQLTLARAIHQIEAKNFEAALADARSIQKVAGSKAEDRGFQQSLMLSGLELQAAALVRLNRPAEAEQVALQMAAAAPYDLLAHIRAAPYVGLTAGMTPAKRAYFDQFDRLMPTIGLARRSRAAEWTNDFVERAADYQTLLDVNAGFADKPAPQPALIAVVAVADALAGKTKEADAKAAEAQGYLDEWEKNGKAVNYQTVVNEAEEMLDFEAIARQVADGKLAEARAAFAARSRWISPGPPAVAFLTAKLREGTRPEDLKGALARDPDAIRTEALAAQAGSIINDANAPKNLYGAIRAYISDGEYAPATRAVWRGEKSRYLYKKTAKDTFVGDIVTVTDIGGIPAGQALLLHCAVLAQARGKTGFVLGPVRQRLNMALVRFGNPGEPGFPEAATMKAADVIAALSQDMPDPDAKIGSK